MTMDPQLPKASSSHILEEKTGSDSYHVEDSSASSLSPEHAEFVMQRHKTLDLSPVPSMDPADPLNWPSWKKHANLCLVAFHAMMTTFIAAGIIPAYETLATEVLHVSIQEVSYLTGVQILFLGVATIIWIPISHRFGRRPVWLFSTFASALCCIGCAKSKTYGVMMVCRVLQSIFISPPLAIGSGVVVETFFSHERGRKLGIWTLLVTLGPPGGPFIMGFVTQHLGWEWVYWIFAIINGAQFVAYLFFGPETRYIEPQDQNMSQFKVEYLQLRRIDPSPFSASDFFGPLKLMLYLDILVPAVSYSLVFGFCSVAIIIELPQLFGPTFGLNAQEIGLQFIALIIGTVIGEQCGGPLSDFFMKRNIKKLNGRRPRPEHRLWLSYFGFICAIVGMIIFCVQMQKAAPMKWNVTPLIGIGIMGFGNQVVTTVLITYAVDCHPQQSASIGIIVSLVRQVWGFVCPFWVPQMFENLGYGGSAGLVSGLIVAVSILPLLLLQWTRSRKDLDE